VLTLIVSLDRSVTYNTDADSRRKQ
jgi:hypothetical protein